MYSLFSLFSHQIVLILFLLSRLRPWAFVAKHKLRLLDDDASIHKGDEGALWSLTGACLTSPKCPATGIVWPASTASSKLNCFVLFRNDVLVCVRDLDYYYIYVTITGEAFYPTGQRIESSSWWCLLFANCQNKLDFCNSNLPPASVRRTDIIVPELCVITLIFSLDGGVAEPEAVPCRQRDSEGVI